MPSIAHQLLGMLCCSKQVGGKVADSAQNLAEGAVGAIGSVATSVKDHTVHGLQKTGEVIGESPLEYFD
ncbi:hypothetical protein OSTOST_25781 [Ostertagia ostertagi]